MTQPNKTLIVTGGSRGIGAAIAHLAAQQGYNICICYRHHETAAHAVIDAINANGGQAIAIAADVSQEADVVRLFEQTIARFGAIYGLVNNAGILETQMRVEQMDAERLQRIFATNVFGSFLCAREAVRHMSSRHGGTGGAIVNISSGAALTGSPGEYVDYAASKGALDTFTIGLAREVATEGIRVNSVRAGFIATDIHASGGDPNRIEHIKTSIPMQRGGTPDEVAHAVLWLLSDQATYTTGAFIDVTGGR